jgi:hypothetical protein
MKNTKYTKFVEDLLKEEEIDDIALSKAKFKHPIKTWFNYNVFLLGVFIKEQILSLRLFVVKTFKTK